MTEFDSQITDDELADFTARRHTLNQALGHGLIALQPAASRYLLRTVRRRAAALPHDIAEAADELAAAHRRLFRLAQEDQEHRYLLGQIDTLPGDAAQADAPALLPRNPGAVVRAGSPAHAYVRDSHGAWIGDHGDILDGDDAMRSFAAAGLEILSPGVPHPTYT